MTEQHPPDGEKDRVEIVFELPHSPEGTYRYQRGDGTTVRVDASGEWTLDDDGEVDDIVFFVSPRWLTAIERRGFMTHKPLEESATRRRLDRRFEGGSPRAG
jgi:hypothetical protein